MKGGGILKTAWRLELMIPSLFDFVQGRGEYTLIENIKILANITGTSKDTLIEYWIKVYTDRILLYCSLEELPASLENVVEQIVAKIIKEKITNPSDAPVKSMSRGDYSVTYAIDNSTGLDPLLIPYKLQLNGVRKVRWK